MRYTAVTSSRRKGRWSAATIRSVVSRLSPWVRRFLDESLPLENGSYQDVVAFKVVDKQLRIQLKNGKETTLRTPAQFVGYRGDTAALTCILLKK